MRLDNPILRARASQFKRAQEEKTSVLSPQVQSRSSGRKNLTDGSKLSIPRNAMKPKWARGRSFRKRKTRLPKRSHNGQFEKDPTPILLKKRKPLFPKRDRFGRFVKEQMPGHVEKSVCPRCGALPRRPVLPGTPFVSPTNSEARICDRCGWDSRAASPAKDWPKEVREAFELKVLGFWETPGQADLYENADTFREARVGNEVEEQRFSEIENTGCCGSFSVEWDLPVIPPVRVRYGFNHGH